MVVERYGDSGWQVRYTDAEAIGLVYGTVRKMNPNVRKGDFRRNPYKNEYIANFQGREGYACCLFVDRKWFCERLGTGKVWFADKGIRAIFHDRSKIVDPA